MPVINHVPELVAEKFGGKDKINITRVQEGTGLTYVTARKWIVGDVGRFDPAALVAWCKYLDVGVGDLLEYVPDEAVQS